MIHSAMTIASMQSSKVYVVYDNERVFAVFKSLNAAQEHADQVKKEKGLAGYNDTRIYICARVIR